MNIKDLLYKPGIKPALYIVLGICLGWFFFHGPRQAASPAVASEHMQHDVWTCAMHPQIRRDGPGQCPICGMDLVPLQRKASESSPGAVSMTEEAVRLAQVQITAVVRRPPVKEVRLYGKIQADERLVKTQPAHIPGRVERLMVNFTGEEVRQGQPIAEIYSPALVTAQEELFEALKLSESYPRLLQSSREKLRQWKLSEAQIDEIEKSGEAKSVFPVHATVSGVVIAKKVNQGDYVSQGAPLYEITDLSRVWALFDAYESDLTWISKGDNIVFTQQARPGRTYSGKVSFIDPVINPQTRVARVRIEMDNRDGSLKPEMFVTGRADSRFQAKDSSLVIPQTAVLWTGTRSIVYVKQADAGGAAFLMREVALGPALGHSYIILDGLHEGEEIVTNGAFSIDAAAQLAGKPSMMNASGEKVSTGHQHGGKNDLNSGKSIGSDHQVQGVTGKDAGRVKTDAHFRRQLTGAYQAYLALKDAFVSSDAGAVASAAKAFLDRLGAVDTGLLKGSAHEHWMDLSEEITKNLQELASSREIEKQRAAFAVMNSAFYKIVKTFGLSGVTSYYQYCPMAVGNKGAYWLSGSKEIRNPYFGDAMLECGETREIIE
ncbi:efflux RND transporter periplasmic adaptor subunit [Fibrobacterota bacterium]